MSENQTASDIQTYFWKPNLSHDGKLYYWCSSETRETVGIEVNHQHTW